MTLSICLVVNFQWNFEAILQSLILSLLYSFLVHGYMGSWHPICHFPLVLSFPFLFFFLELFFFFLVEFSAGFC